MASTTSRTLISIPPEVLDEIAFYTVFPSPSSTTSTPIGPPKDLYNLLLTSRHITFSPSLLSRVFRLQFDVDALLRRFGAQWATANVLAEELKTRWSRLKRVRRYARDFENMQRMRESWDLKMKEVVEDMWALTFMIMESDGKNVLQVHWANTRKYLEAYIHSTLLPRAEKHGFMPESVDSALTISLSWLLTDEEYLSKEPLSQLSQYTGLIRPFVFNAHRYDAYFAPWSLFDLPLITSSPAPLPARYRHILYKPYEAHDQTPANNGQPVTYLGKQLLMSAPIMSLSAICSYFARVVLHHRNRPTTGGTTTGAGPAPNSLPLAPPPSLAATAAPVVGAGLGAAAHYACVTDSKTHDADFSRLIGCLNPRLSSLPLAHQSFYKPGTLAGMWEGRFAFFEFDAYRDMLIGYKPPAQVPVSELLTGQQTQVWRIDEYHLFESTAHSHRKGKQAAASNSPSAYTNSTEDDSREVERLATGHALNAHLPHRCRFVEVPGGIEVFEEGKREDGLFYKKFTDTPSSPSSSISPETDEPILDTLITGSGHSAWGPFTLRGRVREWDGLISVLKDYSSPSDGQAQDDAEQEGNAHGHGGDRGRWVYRGYVLGGGTSWVGRWRDTVTELQFCGYEGAFGLHARR